MRRGWALAVFVSLVACALPARAADDGFVVPLPVSLAAGEQAAPAVFGSRVVFEDNRSGDWDIWTADLRTGAESPLVVASGDQRSPDTDRTIVVWQDDRSGNWDVRMLDLATGIESPVASAAGDQVRPRVSGPRIAWQDSRGGNWDIFMRDTSSGLTIPVVTHPADQINPEIDGPSVVWEDYRNGNADIHLKDVDSGCEAAVVTDPADQTAPSISGPVVAFEDMRSGVAAIRYVDTTSQQQVELSGPTDRRAPSISGSRIAWTEVLDGIATVRVRDIPQSAEIAVVPSSAGRFRPALAGATVVWDEAGDVWWTEVGSPSVSLVRPKQGTAYVQDVEGPLGVGGAPALVAGTSVTFEASAADAESSIAQVTFTVGEAVVCTVTTAPYSCSWTVSPGTHTVVATGSDRAGNSAAASVDVVAV